MVALTLTQARGLKGYLMNSLEGAQRYLSIVLTRDDLNPQVRSRMVLMNQNFGDAYGALATADDVLLISVVETVQADLDYERAEGVLKGMN